MVEFWVAEGLELWVGEGGELDYLLGGCGHVDAGFYGQAVGLLVDEGALEIGEFYVVVMQKYVARSEIPMQYPFLLQLNQPLQNLTTINQNLPILQPPPPIINPILQIPIITNLHNKTCIQHSNLFLPS